jgi:uncharacterized protein DUF4149
MLALRYVGLLALVAWVGGLFTLGAIGAPSIFGVIEGRQVSDGRVIAGAIFAETLRRFHLFSYGCGAVLLATFMVRAVLGPRPRRFAIRAAIACVMLAATLYSGMVVSSQIAGAQAAIGVAPSSLPESDPRRAQFGRLHATSTGLLLIPVIGGLMLLFWELKD